MTEETGPIELPPLSLIKKMREELGWTQKELAARLEKPRRRVGHTTISKIEKNENYHASYITIAEIFNILNEALYGPKNIWNQYVSKFMNQPVRSVTPDDRIMDAINKMEEGGLSQLPVLEKGGRNAGTVTESTILMNALRSDELVRNVAGPKLPVLGARSRLREARRLLLYEPAVLIAEGDGNKIIGIVTRHDVFRVLRKQQSLM